MLASRPAGRAQTGLCKCQRAVFQRRRQRVIPSVQEAERGDNGGNLDNLGVAKMRFDRIEMRGLGLVRHAAASLRIRALTCWL